jgi:hypothetical protein
MRLHPAIVLFAVVPACSGQSSTLGLGEPVRVRSAQFIPGDPEATESGPRVTTFDTANRVIRSGEVAKALSGHATPDASSVGLRLQGFGTGYWVLPVEAPDLSAEGALLWTATLDFARDLPAGFHNLLAYAMDGAGHAGPPSTLDVCLAPVIPDNLNACEPSRAPPTAVLSLVWDAGVDLDLRVRTPVGKVVGGKTFTTAPIVDGGVSAGAVADPSTGTLDVDSNRACIDGPRRETIVWQGIPTTGLYQAWANLFDACGQTSVRFRLELYTSQPDPASDAGTRHLVGQVLASGELLKGDANGGAGPGLFVTEFNFQ